MPDIETGTVIDTVKRSSPKIPIVVIAANRSEEFERVIRERGILYYTTKPFSIELLKLAIKDALAAREKTGDREDTGVKRDASQ